MARRISTGSGSGSSNTLGGIALRNDGFSISSALQIFVFTENLKGGEAIAVFGAFSSSAKICLALDDATSYIYVPLISGQQQTNFVVGRLPATMPIGVYQIWVEVGSSRSASKYANRAIVDTINSNIIHSKSPLTICGKNLMKPGKTPTMRFISQSNGAILNATFVAAGSHEHKLNFMAPASLVTAVVYDIYVSNGYGGTVAEVHMIDTVTTVAAVVDNFQLTIGWSAKILAATFTNTSSLSPIGGASNDLSALNSALTAANAAGGTVNLAAGTFKADGGTLNAKANVVLKGAGPEKTIIKYGYTGSVANFIAGASTCGFVGITFQNNDTTTASYGLALFSSHNYVFFKNCTFIMEHGDFMQLHGCTNIKFINCKWYSKGTGNAHGALYITSASFFTFQYCLFHCATQHLWIHESAKLFVENCRVVRDISYVPLATPVWHLFIIDFLSEFIFDDIEFTVINGVVPGYTVSNDGESFICENGASNPDQDYGTATSATSTTLTDSSKAWSTSFDGYKPTVWITKGTGIGQQRRITSRTATVLTVTTAWDVTPDSTSKYTIGNPCLENGRLVNLKMKDQQRGITLYSSNIINVDIVDCDLLNSGGIDITPYQIQQSDKRAHITRNVDIDSCRADASSDLINGASIGVQIDQFIYPINWGTLVMGLRMIRSTVVGSTTNKDVQVDAAWPTGFNAYLYWQQNVTPYDPTNSGQGVLGTIIQDCKAVTVQGAVNLNTGSYFTTIIDMELNDSTALSDTTISGSGHASVSTVTI